MIYDQDPTDQLEECFSALTTLKYALENTEIFCDNSPAFLLQQIETSLKDAIERIEKEHQATRNELLIFKAQKISDKA